MSATGEVAKRGDFTSKEELVVLLVLPIFPFLMAWRRGSVNGLHMRKGGLICVCLLVIFSNGEQSKKNANSY